MVKKNQNLPDHCHHISGTQVKAHSNHHQSLKNQNVHSFCHQHPHDGAFSSMLMSWVYIYSRTQNPTSNSVTETQKRSRKFPNSGFRGNSKPLKFKKTTRKTSSLDNFVSF